MRQRAAGHLLTVRAVSGLVVTVRVQEEGELLLAVSSEESSGEAASLFSVLEHDVFTPMV